MGRFRFLSPDIYLANGPKGAKRYVSFLNACYRIAYWN